MDNNDNRAAIVTFDIEKVTNNKEKLLQLFFEVDDGLDIPEEHRRESSKALLNRILAKEEIHLLAIEADFIKSKLPDVVLEINYYE